MAPAILALDTARSGRSQTGVVWVGLCLRLDNLWFPDAGWTDFAVVVLGWWIRVLLAILRGAKGPQEIMFMEGPFSVEVEAVTAATLRVTCVERAARRLTRAEAVVDSRLLVESAVRAGEEVLELCRSKSWWSVDADVLESGLRELKQEMITRAN